MGRTTINIYDETKKRFIKAKGSLELKNGELRSEDCVLNALIDFFESIPKLKEFYDKLMAFENELIADCGQGKSFEAGIYAGKVANLRKDLEEIMKHA